MADESIELNRLADCPEDVADFRFIRLAALQGDPEAFGETYASVADLDAAGWADKLRNILAKPGNVIFVARRPPQVYGMACFGPHAKDVTCGYMWGVYVAEAHRGTGLADRMIAAGLDWLRQQAIRNVVAEVAARNARAIAFYRRLGFTIDLTTATVRVGTTIMLHPISLDLTSTATADNHA